MTGANGLYERQQQGKALGKRIASHRGPLTSNLVEEYISLWPGGSHAVDAELIRQRQTARIDELQHEIGKRSDGGAAEADRNADPETTDALQRLNDCSSAPKLKPTALHGLAGDWVRLVDPHTESAPAARLVQLLVAFGNSVGPAPYVFVDGAAHRARLFALIVGASAKSRKGTSWAHVRNVMALSDPGWTAERLKSGLSSGEGLIEAVADPTEDKDGNLVGGVTDKRLLLVEAEFARVLTAGGREGSTLSEVVRQAWDQDQLSTLTKKPVIATGAHVSLIGHIVAEELRAKLTSTDRANGFANRFLFVHAERHRFLPEGSDVPSDQLKALAAELRRRLDIARRRGRVERTPAAAQRWAELYSGPLAQDDPGGLLGAVVARSEAQVLRLSLVYALLDGAPAIDLVHLEAAYALWRYCRATAAFIFGDRLGDDTADRLLDAVRAAGPGGLDGKDQAAVFGRNVAAAEIERARRYLTDRGLVVTHPADDGTRRFTTIAAEYEKDENNENGSRLS